MVFPYRDQRVGTGEVNFEGSAIVPVKDLWTYGPGLGATRSGSYSPAPRALVADLMRRLGLDRFLFGTDMPLSWPCAAQSPL